MGQPRPRADMTATGPDARSEPPVLTVTLWPNRSLTSRGGAWIIGVATAGMALPLLALGGTAAGWGLMPFPIAALLGLYFAIRRNCLDGRMTEELRLWPDLITVVRRDPSGGVRSWQANPFWVRLRLIEDAHVEKYLTLEGNGREIELGSFLSPWERETLYNELRTALARLRP